MRPTNLADAIDEACAILDAYDLEHGVADQNEMQRDFREVARRVRLLVDAGGIDVMAWLWPETQQ